MRTEFLPTRRQCVRDVIVEYLQFQDFKCYATTASLKDNAKLERSVALFNGLSQWIQCMVLSKTTPQQRAGVIVKFADVAKVRPLNGRYTGAGPRNP